MRGIRSGSAYPFILALALIGVPLATSAAPGSQAADERARLAAISALGPLVPIDGTNRSFVARPKGAAADADGWSVGVQIIDGTVVSEDLFEKIKGKRYAIETDGRANFTAIFGASAYGDLRSSSVIATNSDDPDITSLVRRGSHFAFRIVDDQRNGIHSLTLYPLAALAQALTDGGFPTVATSATMPAASDADALFAVDEEGGLEPILLRVRGTYRETRLTGDGTLTPASAAAVATIAAANKNVHVIFGGRTIATVPANTAHLLPRVALPASLHLGGEVQALASPTLDGHRNGVRRAATTSERAAALALAATKLKVRPTALVVSNLTAIELGRGMAIVGTVSSRGTGSPRVDKRLFFVAESTGGALALTLANVQSITMVDPMLIEARERLIDAIDLGDGTLSLVTMNVGFDAHTYSVYTRSVRGWKSVYQGGGIAL